MANEAIPVAKGLHGDLWAEVVTLDPTLTGESRPALIVQFCAGEGTTIVLIGVRPWDEQVHSVTASEVGEEVEVAAWTRHRAPISSNPNVPFGAAVRWLLWTAVVSLRRPLVDRRVVATPLLASSLDPHGPHMAPGA